MAAMGMPATFHQKSHHHRAICPKEFESKIFLSSFFFSEETGAASKVLIERDVWDLQIGRLEKPKDRLGKPMEPDVVEELFFNFASKF
jgi:hypothetical protein